MPHFQKLFSSNYFIRNLSTSLITVNTVWSNPIKVWRVIVFHHRAYPAVYWPAEKGKNVRNHITRFDTFECRQQQNFELKQPQLLNYNHPSITCIDSTMSENTIGLWTGPLTCFSLCSFECAADWELFTLQKQILQMTHIFCQKWDAGSSDGGGTSMWATFQYQLRWFRWTSCPFCDYVTSFFLVLCWLSGVIS